MQPSWALQELVMALALRKTSLEQPEKGPFMDCRPLSKDPFHVHFSLPECKLQGSGAQSLATSRLYPVIPMPSVVHMIHRVSSLHVC